jgi:hypothetical protein
LGLLSNGESFIKVHKGYIYALLLGGMISVCFLKPKPFTKDSPAKDLVNHVQEKLLVNPKDVTILQDTEKMKFWFPSWNEALAIEMEYFFKNDEYEEFNQRYMEILRNKNNKSYLAFCWYYKISEMVYAGDLPEGVTQEWELRDLEYSIILRDLFSGRQRDSNINIKLRIEMAKFIKKYKLDVT